MRGEETHRSRGASSGTEPGFRRPHGWGDLDGGSATAQDAEAPAPEAAGESGTGLTPRARRAAPRESAPVSGFPLHLLLLAAVLVLAPALVVWIGGTSISPTQPRESTRPRIPVSERNPPPIPTETAPQLWGYRVEFIRSDVADPRFETSVDGFWQDGIFVDADEVWVAISRAGSGGSHRLHGLDSATGEMLWERSLEGAYCARQLFDELLACAEATAWQSGLGVEWMIHLMDPETGRSVQSAPFAGWVAGIFTADAELVLLEQRLPAPHATLTALDGALQPAWHIDLSDHEGHDGMFSNNRIIIRGEEYPDGPALDRPRLRRVGDGLHALWIGSSTAFIDASAGRMLDMPHCSRLVDDGVRLWCNAGDHTVARDYQLDVVARTESGIRLAFPDYDNRAGDVTYPAFLDPDGRLMEVDLATGATVGRLVDTSMGDAFGLAVSPNAASVGDTLLAADNQLTVALNPHTNEIKWSSKYGFDIKEPILRGGSVLLGGSRIYELDLTTGELVGSWRLERGYHLVAAGEKLAGIGLDEISRIDL